MKHSQKQLRLGAWALGLFLGSVSCASLQKQDAASTKDAAVPPESQEIERARQRGHAPRIAWQEFAPQAFARARAEGRLVLLDCVAVWCHWCHVMDETTYADPAVSELLAQRFVAVRVDVDSRPDLAGRYENWGWPATVILTAEGEELGKFRGYLAPEELRAALVAALAPRASSEEGGAPAEASALVEPSASLDALPWVGARVARALDALYDEREGGWGFRQKLPIGVNLEFELVRARHGEKEAEKRARYTFEKHHGVYDPVWGGVYQYSVGGVWTKPHFEKLMPLQTAEIEALARAFTVTRERKYLDDALRIEGYLQKFLRDKDGAFLVSQDADLGGAEGHGRFVDGHVYYALDDAHRRELGTPRVDSNVYPYENGLAIAALSALAGATDVPAQAEALLSRARRAADLLLSRNVDSDGTVWRRRSPPGMPRYLADAASLGRGLALLAARTHEPRYLSASRKIAAAMLRLFAVSPGELVAGASPEQRFTLWAHTPDPAAVGVFGRRERPFEQNVLAARFLLAVGDPPLRQRARVLLAAVSTPQALDGQRRLIGDYLLALDEAGALRWRDLEEHHRPEPGVRHP